MFCGLSCAFRNAVSARRRSRVRRGAFFVSLAPSPPAPRRAGEYRAALLHASLLIHANRDLDADSILLFARASLFLACQMVVFYTVYNACLLAWSYWLYGKTMTTSLQVIILG